MFESGMDVVNIRKETEKNLKNFFEQSIIVHMKQLNIDKLKSLYTLMMKTREAFGSLEEPTISEFSRFISMIASSLIIYDRMITMPPELQSLCEELQRKIMGEKLDEEQGGYEKPGDGEQGGYPGENNFLN